MATLKYHFKSILYNNFDPFRETFQLKFTKCPPTRAVPDFSIGYIDGFTKGLICQSIVGLIDYLETWPGLVRSGSMAIFFASACFCHLAPSEGFNDELDELQPLLESLHSFRCQYHHHEEADQFCYEALRHLPFASL